MPGVSSETFRSVRRMYFRADIMTEMWNQPAVRHALGFLHKCTRNHSVFVTYTPELRQMLRNTCFDRRFTAVQFSSKVGTDAVGYHLFWNVKGEWQSVCIWRLWSDIEPMYPRQRTLACEDAHLWKACRKVNACVAAVIECWLFGIFLPADTISGWI